MVYAGVDYAAILEQAVAEADVIVWDGGNNDFPFVAPDLLIVVTDPLRPGDELRYHPGETNLRMADVVVINKVDRASTDALATVLGHVQDVNPGAVVVRTASPVSLGQGRSCVAAASSWSRTDRPSRMAAWRTAPGRSPPRENTQGNSSTRALGSRVDRGHVPAVSAHRQCAAPRWATHASSSTTSRARSARSNAMWSWSERPSASGVSSTSDIRLATPPTRCVRSDIRIWPMCSHPCSRRSPTSIRSRVRVRVLAR